MKERRHSLLKERQGPEPRFWVLGFGESRDVPMVEVSRRIAR